jgi:hypothetical protein
MLMPRVGTHCPVMHPIARGQQELGFRAGAFYDRDKKIAVFSYAASGCESLSLSVGLNQSTSLIFGKVALAAQPSPDAGLATALGIPADAIHQRPS